MKDIFIEILYMSLMASITACAVQLMRLILMKAPKIFSYALWAVVLFRLLCPFKLESSLSFLPARADMVSQEMYTQIPTITTDIVPVNNAVNQSLPAVNPSDSIGPVSSLPEIAAYIWLGGMLTLLGYAVFSYVRLKYRMKTAVLVRDNIYETDQIITPFVMGLIKPGIYLPIGMENIDYILCHEQTHIRRRDYLIKPIAFLALCLHWFNPVIWVSYFLMCRDMEMSCDESVLKHSGEDIRKRYSDSLLALSVRQSGLLSPLAFGESNTKTRIKNVLCYRKPSFWVSIAAGMVVLCMTIGCAANRTQQPDNLGDDTVETNLPEDSGNTMENSIDQTEPVQDGTGEIPPEDSDAGLPHVKELTVIREGYEETLTAQLTFSETGYAIYLLEGFVLIPTDDGDVIQKADSDPIIGYSMHIVRTDGTNPLPERTERDEWVPAYNNTLKWITDYQRITAENHIFDVTFDYTMEAEEGGVVLLQAMLDTIMAADFNSAIAFASDIPQKYDTEADFLNSVEGVAFQAVAYKAAKALLSADAEELAEYLLDPSTAARATRDLTNIFDNVEYMFLVWSLDSIKSDSVIQASYRYAVKGEDSVSYVTMELIKEEDIWKVQWLGIEK